MGVAITHILRNRWGELCHLLLRIICSDIIAHPNYASSRSTIAAIQRSCMVALDATELKESDDETGEQEYAADSDTDSSSDED